MLSSIPNSYPHSLAILFPGQGSQRPNMFDNWKEKYSQMLLEWSNILEFDFMYYANTASLEEITPTEITQPLLCCLGMLGFIELKNDIFSQSQSQDKDGKVFYFAGHSAGQITASAACGILDPIQALKLAKKRGEIMSSASQQIPGKMTAWISTSPLSLENIFIYAEKNNVSVANVNSAYQIVISGAEEFIDALTPPAKTRLLPLSVSGAFHSPAMGYAQAEISDFISTLSIRPPRNGYFLSNRTGQPVRSVEEWANELVFQLVGPVRWDLCLEYLQSQKVCEFLEMPPAKTLRSSVKKTIKPISYKELLTCHPTQGLSALDLD